MSFNFTKNKIIIIAQSLRTKILLLNCAVVLITAILVGYFNYSGAIVALALVPAIIVITNNLTRPLRRMTREIILAKNGKKILNLPVNLQGEVGELARAFREKTEDFFASQERVNSIINSIIDGIVLVNKDGKIDSYSDVCKDIFGHDLQDVIGKDFTILLRWKGGLNLEISELISRKQELVGIHKNGLEFPLEVSIKKIAISNGNLFCLMVRDISERKRVENMKNEFISTMNHEIRTPLTSIKGSIGLLKIKTKGILDEGNKKLLDISYKNCERLSFLVNDILDIEKISAGKMEYYFETAEINDAVISAVEKNEGYAEKFNVKFTVKPSTDKIFCKIDISRFEQVLDNLLSNAAKFSHENDDILITVSRRDEDSVKIAVTDHGDGIPLAFRDKIFSRFAQADSSSVRKRSGTGLGLSIAKSIVEDFGGEIGFDTKEEGGTTFYVILSTVTK
jgi:PAS domain S-box-containing protein